MQEAPTLALSEVTADHFEPHVGEAFVLQAEDPAATSEPVDCELVEIGRAPWDGEAAGVGRRKPFSLLFRGRQGRSLDHGLHSLVHDQFQIRNLFVNRVQLPRPRPGEQGSAYYEAVFG